MFRKNMAPLTPKDLLLASRLEVQEVASLLRPYGFKEIEKADANLQAMADDPRARRLLSEIIDELLICLAQSADPDQALNYLERFTRAALNKTHLFSYLKASPRTLELLAKTFGSSPFMAEILIRDPVYLYWVSDPCILHKERKKRDLARDLSNTLKYLKTEEKKLDVLRTFKRKEILRIGIRDLLKLSDVEETVASLSLLAEVLIQKAYEICASAMCKEYGIPFHRDPAGRRVRTGFTILGMGKLGGGELNFSSDVDLMYLYASDRGDTSRGRSKQEAARIPHPDYFKHLSRKITSALSDMTNEGYVYRIDLRLRPEGRMGNMAYSLKGFKQYYASRGETWERLALLKAWPVGGDHSLGVRFLSTVRPFIYGRPFDLKAQEEVKRMKQRIDQKISIRGQSHRNVKLGFGGIREIELIVQSLQVSFGRKSPKLRGRNTMKALRALFEHRILSEEEHHVLSRSYIFLRDVENKLQMVYDFQIHSIPESAAELLACALRIGYRDTDQATAEAQFLRDYHFHTGQVNGVFQRVFYPSESSRFYHQAALTR